MLIQEEQLTNTQNKQNTIWDRAELERRIPAVPAQMGAPIDGDAIVAYLRDHGETHIATLMTALGKTEGELVGALATLELYGKIRRMPGYAWSATEPPTTADLLALIPGAAALMGELDALRPEPPGCYAALVGWSQSASLIPTLPTTMIERAQLEQRKETQVMNRQLARRIQLLEVIRRGWRQRATAITEQRAHASDLNQRIIAAERHITAVAIKLSLKELLGVDSIDRKVECLCEYVWDRSDTIRTVHKENELLKLEVNELKQRLAQRDGAPLSGQTGPDSHATHAPASQAG